MIPLTGQCSVSVHLASGFAVARGFRRSIFARSEPLPVPPGRAMGATASYLEVTRWAAGQELVFQLAELFVWDQLVSAPWSE